VTWRRVALAVVVVLVLGVAWLWVRLDQHPSLAPYERLALPVGGEPGGVRVRFLGVSTLVVSDGETVWMTDGFFSRPGFLRTALGRIEPDSAAISSGLSGAGVHSLAAVIVLHSHYDHAMDAPLVAAATRAELVGSESTANVARGVGFPEDRFVTLQDGMVLRYGRFEIEPIRALHFPHGMAMGEITAPLVPPARATDYREGGTWSLLVRHPSGTLLIHGSAGWVDGMLAERRADVVLLGIGGLGTKDEAYRDAYWREVVGATSPRLLVPIHWDDFTIPLGRPLQPMPTLLDDFDASMRFLMTRAAATPDLSIGMFLAAGEERRLLPPPAAGR
jgi:L-ascorbate metabolism protein UlaG (beta-lactamase superfamily)